MFNNGSLVAVKVARVQGVQGTIPKGVNPFFPIDFNIEKTKKHMAHSQHLQRPAWPMSCNVSPSAKAHDQEVALRLSEKLIGGSAGGKAVRIRMQMWATHWSFIYSIILYIILLGYVTPRNQTSCPDLDGQLWIQHDLLIAHALQNQTHYRVLSSSERFGGHSDILRAGWGEKIGWGKGSFPQSLGTWYIKTTISDSWKWTSSVKSLTHPPKKKTNDVYSNTPQTNH